MAGRRARQLLVAHWIPRGLRCSDLLEVPDNRRRQVQVELPALHSSDAEAVLDTGWDVDEGPGRTDALDVADEDDVLALQDVERLGRVVMDVQRRPEPCGSSASNKVKPPAV